MTAMSPPAEAKVTEDHRAAAHAACHPLTATCGGPHCCERIARAFAARDRAAEQRGAEREREACADIAREHAATNRQATEDYARSEMAGTWQQYIAQGGSLTAEAIREAIRARGPR